MIALSFLWHQHQPYYPDDVAGENLMPWVRLHGVKDYYGMAMHLKEFPEMACTINLVPSLLLQIRQYTEHGGTDKSLDMSRIPAADLTEHDCLYLLDNFFLTNPEQMIRPLPRFYELYQRRGMGQNTAREALRRFKERELRDLQVLYNLAWVHPLAIEQDQGLQELVKKGRRYSEEEKNWLLDKHLDILRQIIPLHRELAGRGQVELTTTPFYHPIFPLLLDKKLAREAHPDMKLPRHLGNYPEDAELHLRRAIDQHSEIFGQPPQGMWPAEGSVCQSMIAMIARHGISWIATDEAILGQSTQGFIGRDAHGRVRNPDRMFRPYRVREGEAALDIVFRDHLLSDRIGFHYQRSTPAEAVEDFLLHLHNIERQVDGADMPLVTVILDGENCWEHYPGGGVEFLRTLYQRCTQIPNIRPTKIGSFLKEHPPRDSLPRLFAGSWIRHDFAIWIGQEEDNTAWDLLHQTRDHLRKRAEQKHVSQEQLTKAWEEIYIAEGSDWFWWYGEDHSSAQDDLFDYLFRKHLQNVYLLLGESPPPELKQRIKRRGLRVPYTLPRSFLDVTINGQRTFFEWLGAGKYAAQNERGTMALVTPGPIKEVHFGFDLETFLLRIDFDGPASEALLEFDAIRIGFTEPAGWELLLQKPATTSPAVRHVNELEAKLYHEGRQQHVPADQRLEVAVDRIVEVAVSFALLGLDDDQPLRFYVEILEGRQSRDRAPREGIINLTCPTPYFEQIMWQV